MAGILLLASRIARSACFLSCSIPASATATSIAVSPEGRRSSSLGRTP